jgi:hypothetical protein
MPTPTIQNYFGTNAEITTNVNGDPILVVKLSDFSAEGLVVPGDPSTLKGSQLAASLAIKWLTLSVGLDDDPLVGVLVNSPRTSLTERGEVKQKSTEMSLQIFTPDNTPAVPDPDLVV